MNKKIKLASKTTIEDYESMEKDENKEGIANFVFNRLSERYLIPLENVVPSNKLHGFALMANACLLIETYESFIKGWKDTAAKERHPFDSFFKREEGFKDFKYNGRDFYKDVRCGILHQGETKGGWKITRIPNTPIFNRAEKTINASKFFEELRVSLESYRELLINSEWDDLIWENCRKKISFIIENCK
jgi:hypothetical protein